ncbi:MAG: hypothetical protein WCK42_05085 [Myxococcaceae bacterium]
MVQVTAHDRSQIEISLDYCPSLSNVFYSDLYFFLPRNLGVHSNSYLREQFYSDLVNHLRFHTPIDSELLQEEVVTLSKILDANTTVQEREQLTPVAIQQVKLFASRVNTQLKNFYASFSIDKLQKLYESISIFRIKFIKPIQVSSLRVSLELRQILLNCDEFVSNRLQAACSELISGVSNKILSDILVQEKKYRKSLGSLFVDIGTSERELEYFYFRHSLLKKQISQPLHIDKKSTKQERVYRNWVAGLGAALAGFWAQIADYQAYKSHGYKDIGLSAIGIGCLAVFAYIFKDRIKDVSKEYISDKMKLFLPDYRSKLEFCEIEPEGKKVKKIIGNLSECMRFSPVNQIPEDIFYIRKLKGRRDIGTENQETVIQYHKYVHFDEKVRVLGRAQNLCNIKDIHKFNFSYFLHHLDDAKKQLSIYDEDEGPSRISAPKVYHVNIVSHVRAKSVSTYNHFRVILDKGGIVRIETVLPTFNMENGEVKL